MKTTFSASQSSYLYLRTPQDMVLDLYDSILKKKMKLNRDMENLRKVAMISNKYILVPTQSFKFKD